MTQDNSYDFETYALWQMHNVDVIGSKLKPEDYSSDEEYKKALIEQYKALREQEYQVVCYNVGIEMYHDSRCVNITTGNTDAMDTHIWNGCRNIETVRSDSIVCSVPQNVMNRYENSGKNACCAVTGSTIVQKICSDMNCMNNANIVQFDKSKDFKYWHTGAGHFTWDPNSAAYSSGTKVVPLQAAILNEKIGPGDRLAFPSKAASLGSGFHERTIAAINKDDDGNILGYTLVANNPTEFSYHDIKNTGDPYNFAKVKFASTNKWMNDQINLECQHMENMSVEEIQQKIDQTKDHTKTTILETVRLEEDLLTNTDYTSNSIDSTKQTPAFTLAFNAQYQQFSQSGFTLEQFMNIPTDSMYAGNVQLLPVEVRPSTSEQNKNNKLLDFLQKQYHRFYQAMDELKALEASELNKIQNTSEQTNVDASIQEPVVETSTAPIENNAENTTDQQQSQEVPLAIKMHLLQTGRSIS